MDSDELAYFDRRPATSGRVSYCDPVIIRDNRAVRIEALPYFIPHNSSHAELAVKIVRTEKRTGDICEISLKEEDLRVLHQKVGQMLSVAEQEDDGRYLVLRMDQNAQQPEMRDEAVRALGSALESRTFAQRLARHADPVALAEAFSASVRLGELRSAVTELRVNLAEGKSRETIYQDWCERHSWAFGNAYVARDTQRVIGVGDQVDLLLESTVNGFRDIFELKQPDFDVILYDKTHRNWYWSAQTAKSIGQCHRYLDTLHRNAQHGLMPDRPEVVAYHPRAVIVIGRSHDWNPDQLRALHGLNSRMHGINVMTYDQLLARCEALLQQLTDVDRRDNAGEELSA